MPANRAPNGWLVIDKPLGLTSSRAVERVRRAVGAKAGHAGTLDPLATGVLPVALGEATKTIAYAMTGRKTYRFGVRWGVARTTDDSEGDVTAESSVRPDRAVIEAALPQFTGRIMQRPPAYSALKIAGRRAHALARAGHAPALAPRPIEIFALRLLAVPDEDHADFEAVVGKGAYIRALARDLAVALGTVGHVAALRRTAVGAFTEAVAIALEHLENAADISIEHGGLLPIATALGGIPVVSLAKAEAERLRSGQRIMLASVACLPSDRLEAGTVVSAWHDQALVALAKIEGSGLRPLRVINQ